MANVTVKIPTPLRKFTGGNDKVSVEGATVGEAISALTTAHGGLKDTLCDDKGKLRRFVNVYANQEDIRFLEELETPLSDGDELTIIPAIAGGR